VRPEPAEGRGAVARRSDDDEDGPQRTCIATRQARPVAELIRFVAAPDGTVVPDLRHRLPGRGVWVTANRDAVALAVKRNAFARALKAKVNASPDLPDQVERLLVAAARQSVSLANKAGLVVAGFSKVEAAIGRGVAGILQASDAAPDGVRKLGQALRRRYGGDAATIPILTALESVELDLALGRSHVIHAALLDGPAARASIARCRAVELYRARPTQDGPARSDEITEDDGPDPAGTRAAGTRAE
jgi:predicted RNA-binding protein YlxR (DUF448 family)